VTEAAEVMSDSTDIIAIVEASPVTVLTDRQTFNRFYEEMKRQTDALDADVTTDKGRKAIASMAYKVARTKTAIDDAGKKLNEEWRARINAVDESRREIRQQLDDLKEEVRRPLTEWEEADEARQQRCAAVIANLQSAATVEFGETAADVTSRRQTIEALTFNEAEFEGLLHQAQALRQQALDALAAAAERLQQEERDRAELERLRKEQEERAVREAEEARKREEEEATRRAEEERARLAKEAEERRAREIAEAEERARKAAAEEAERRHQEELAAERKRAEEAERAAQADRDRIAREEAQRKAAEEAAAEEQRRREADREHRGKIMGAAKEAIMEAGEVDEAAAKRIVLAIAAGSVPAVAIRF
jgi:colicin import membrane protein